MGTLHTREASYVGEMRTQGLLTRCFCAFTLWATGTLGWGPLAGAHWSGGGMMGSGSLQRKEGHGSWELSPELNLVGVWTVPPLLGRRGEQQPLTVLGNVCGSSHRHRRR